MKDLLQIGREKAESYHSKEGGGFVNEGRLNAYECDAERTVALRKLLEAKDAAVRANVQ